ncbi:MAG: sigma-54 dependent transcriptional regulator [Pirellulales bacterium]
MTAHPAVRGQNSESHRTPSSAGDTTKKIYCESNAALSLRAQIDCIAPRPATVLIEGETGVGKEVAARQIHTLSPRAARPFVPVDCTVFSTELMESQLFGHVKGAFTGAVGAALGFVRCADGGTLFLDEIGELPLSVQAKLLRCLQERTVVPVGGVEPIPVDLRIIAATHRDLAAMVRDGAFRQDLYFRLNVVRLSIEPLRERRDEILTLAKVFLGDIAAMYGEPVKSLTAAAEAALVRYDWPGNVRELRNAIERAFLFCADRTIDTAHLPAEIRAANVPPQAADPWTNPTFEEDSIPRLADAERLLIARVLKVTGGNQSDAARLLDIERHRLRRKIVHHGLEHLARIRPR